MEETAYEGDMMKWRFGDDVGLTRLGATFTPKGAVERHSGPMMPAYSGQFMGLRATAPKVRPKKSKPAGEPKAH
ncbi:hypothetical protein [Caulobacter sp. 17J80-11]|uniref:hypothetical protein n=1 Tax=Caulobacter sp. 17J80-11 TaxID=2763502 RepID=UPI001653BA23|nr:hypothetical protein [Caulobacter sp. 17J80-11]MBC6983685.1 hypothetical protein [Caulobacter sp. 17J80-11]